MTTVTESTVSLQQEVARSEAEYTNGLERAMESVFNDQPE